ncbi:MAG: hypothetical protein QNJ72_16480 [Pleurocapsa sp. MO_226.B13]|nr:hypothetical protein [Pleurocapsa sp. MO_226.B13]
MTVVLAIGESHCAFARSLPFVLAKPRAYVARYSFSSKVKGDRQDDFYAPTSLA